MNTDYKFCIGQIQIRINEIQDECIEVRKMIKNLINILEND